jgi:hypothetical protein
MGGTKSAITVASLESHHPFGNAHGVEQYIPCVQPHVPRLTRILTRGDTCGNGGQSVRTRVVRSVGFVTVITERARRKTTNHHRTELEKCACERM